jgi:ABC-2 type transport system ATP-binding protein
MQVTESALTASGIAVRYGRRAVLEGAGLDLHRGEVVGVVGENGSGKTTLLRVCAGLLAPDAGRVERAGRVGYCPQDPALVELLTPDEHLVLFGRAVGLSRDRAVRDGRRLFDDLGLRAPRGATVKELSGGSRQKVNLALALLGDPDILLLDEPYQGFDHGTYVDFWERVGDWRTAGRAVAVVTHMLAELWRADRVVEVEAVAA